MPEIKVAMISSTIRDLPDHREQARDACLCQDVFPKMMEHWPSSDTDGVAASLKSVDEAEIYIGIFAHRYGYIPKGQDISITEMEYERAVKREIPRLIFLIDDEHHLKISQIEMGAAEKLRVLKERLKSELVVSFFKSPEDLKARIIQGLSNLGTKAVKAQETEKPAVKSAPVFDPKNYIFYVPYRPKGNQVLGRDSALKAVRNQLVNGYRTAIGQTASFQGLGGLGKTQLAVEYAQLFRDQYPNGVIWLNADQDIEAQLIKIAENARWASTESEHKDKLAIAQQRIKTHSHCLIIFDNLEKLEKIKDFLPAPDAEPHILVTSRFDQANFIPVPLDILDGEFSLKLLFQESGHTPTTEVELEAAKEIANKLGGLPLALELAGAYLRHRPIGWCAYSNLLNFNLKAAMPSKFLSGSFTRHESDIYTTLKINEAILLEEPLLREVLDIFTWSGSSAMGLSLLKMLLEEDHSRLPAAISLGVSLRLLQKTPGIESYTLHRLVREVRREDMPLLERQEWAIKISKRLATWFQTLKRNFSDLPEFETEIEHLRAWEENIQKFAPKLASRLIWLQAYPPFHRGSFKDTQRWLEKAMALLEPADNRDLELLKADLLSDLCAIKNQLGEFQESRECGEKALEIRIRLLGENNAETAMSFHNLGGILFRMRKPEMALKHSNKSLEIWRGIHGENHIDTAMALDCLGSIYRELGKNEEALEYANRALAVREKVLGQLHPDTATSLCNIGNVYAGVGNNSRAFKCEEQALKIAEEIFGDRSPMKANILHNFSFVYCNLKDFKKALASCVEAWVMRKEFFGDQHPDALVSAYNVAFIHLKLGHLQAGFQIIDDSLKKIHKDHPMFETLKQKQRDFRMNFSRPGFRQFPKRN